MNQSQYFKEWYKKNREKRLAEGRAYYKKNRIKCLELNRKWIESHKEYVKKKSEEYRRKRFGPKKHEGLKIWCSHCQTAVGPFVKHSSNSYKKQYFYCRKCSNERGNSYYHKNKNKPEFKAKIKEYNRKAKLKRKIICGQYKNTGTKH